MSQMTTAASSEDALLETAPILPEFQCPLCKKVLKDAVEISCCKNNFCDECTPYTKYFVLFSATFW
jgi:protein MPE1